jgi:ATP-dependent DNA helicase PIF1
MLFSFEVKPKMNISDEQKKILNAIINKKNVFITGPGGCGKSYFINFFKEYTSVNTPNTKLALTSTTGISALLIGGCTIHSYLGIGLAKESAYVLSNKIKKSKFHLDRWKKLDILIIDEVSMLSIELFEKLDEIAKKLRKNESPFGGIQLILSGDFLQLPSVNSTSFLFNSKIWKDTVHDTFYLEKIFRQDDNSFIDILSEARFGKLSSDSVKMIRERENATVDISYVPTKLFSLNKNVETYNRKCLDKLTKTEASLFEYAIEIAVSIPNILERVIEEEDIDNMVEDHKVFSGLYHKYLKNIQARRVLEVCTGCHVMMLVNKYFSQGIVNGSQGVVIGFSENQCPIVKFYNGQVIEIEPNIWVIEEDGKEICSYTQIPLKLSYAASIHSSQGATLDYAEIDFDGMFEYGQAYVALSRVKKIENLIVRNFSSVRIKAHPEAIEYYVNLKEDKND